MPSVVKRGKFYSAVFYAPDENGKLTQRWRSTRQTDWRKAMKAALEMEENARQEVAGSSREFLAVVEKAAQMATQGVLTAAAAQNFVAHLYSLSSGEVLTQHTTADWLQVWLGQKRPLTKASSLARYEKAVRHFTQFLKDDANRPLSAITVDHVRRFRDQLKREGRAGKTCNGYLKDLRSAFRAAVREGHLLKSPTENLEFLPEDDSVTRQPFTLEQIAKLVAAAPSEDWKGVILLGAFAGMRIGDATRLMADSVNMDALVFCFKPAKTSRQNRILTVPMHPEVIAYFKTRNLSAKNAPCFPTLHDQPVSGRVGLSISFGSIIDAAGIDREQTPVPGSSISKKTEIRQSHKLSFQSLRHSFVSMMANGDVGAELRMKLAGHSTGDAHEIYTSTEVKTLRRAIEAIPRLKT